MDGGMGWASGEGREGRKVSVRIIVAVVNHDSYNKKQVPSAATQLLQRASAAITRSHLFILLQIRLF
jgi:hypothetical protein